MFNLKGKRGDKEVLNDSSLMLSFEGYRESFSLSCLTIIMFEGHSLGIVWSLILSPPPPPPPIFSYDWRM
jgi:hypothetical protein